MKILLVDDHAVVRQGYASLLRALLPEVQVREACDGEQALQMVQEEIPNLVIMDIGLPVNANRFEALAGMVEEEIKLLKGARKNVRVTGKKTTDERIAEAEAELERLRSL